MASLTQKNGLHHAQLKLEILSLLRHIVREMLQRIHRKDEEEPANGCGCRQTTSEY
jgi:hypothetical protein